MAERIVIIGAGQAGAQVAITLRERGFAGAITVVGEERSAPYQRPPLSKAFLKGAVEEERLYLRPASFYQDVGIELMLGRGAGAIDPAGRRVELADGSEVSYDALVVATGTRPRIPPLPGAGLAAVFSLRSIADVDALRPRLADMKRLAIIGAGYIGLEVAAVLRGMAKDVVVIEAEERPLKRVTSEPVSRFFADLHRANGVELLTSTRVAGLVGEQQVVGVRLEDAREIAVDGVLLAVGAVPNSELAVDAGIAARDGIIVDGAGRTSAPDVFACGDCARFESRRYGRSVRIESVQNAIDQAKTVAATIAGEETLYDPVPWFWSDQYQTKLQIAGLYDPSYEVAVEGDPTAGPFSVEYRRAGRLVAVDAIDNARAHMMARRRIAEETAG